MQISSQRPAMRSGASSVAANKKSNLQNAQANQVAKNVTMSNNSAQQASNQLQAQLSNIGLNFDFKA